nr:hypothetical protein [Kiloniella majae]
MGIGITGTPTVSANGSISANASDRNVDSLTHTNSRILAGNDVTLNPWMTPHSKAHKFRPTGQLMLMLAVI